VVQVKSIAPASRAIRHLRHQRTVAFVIGVYPGRNGEPVLDVEGSHRGIRLHARAIEQRASRLKRDLRAWPRPPYLLAGQPTPPLGLRAGDLRLTRRNDVLPA